MQCLQTGIQGAEYMQVTPLRTKRIESGKVQLLDVVNDAVKSQTIDLESSVLVITSKIVSLCEGSVVPFDSISKRKLVEQESEWFIPPEKSKYGIAFTIKNDTLIPSAGIDESNGGDNYVLWPMDAQNTCDEIRRELIASYGLKNFGVLITDSTCHPMRRGTTGIALAFSGFRPLNDYRGEEDLYGRPFSVSQADVAGGLAAAAVLVMGEGSERTPMAVVADVPFVEFVDDAPDASMLASVSISKEEDLFGVFLDAIEWERGEK